MFSVPSQHAIANTPQHFIEGGFYDMSVFLQAFVRDMTSQLQTLVTVDEIHSWASTALPTFLSQADKRNTALKETVLSLLQSSQSTLPHVSSGIPLAPGNLIVATSPGTFNFDNILNPTGSPRYHRVQSIDTTGDPSGNAMASGGGTGGSSSRTASIRLPPPALRPDGTAAHDEYFSGDDHHPSGMPPIPSISPQSNVSRPGSFSNRVGSFTKKNVNGVDVPMLKDDASGAVVDALNDTYSLASRGSWRRRGGPPSMFSLQPQQQLAVPFQNQAHIANDMKRRAYLSFVHLDGMPNLNIEAESADLRSRFSRPSKRHTAVFRDSADLESLLDECNLPRIHDINSLEFNIFEEYQRYGENAFTIVAMNVLLKYTFITSFHMRIASLLTFVKTVQSFYRSENPFHNAIHAADVLQTTHLYLCQRDVKENFSDVELFALLFAAMCIDVGHLGVNNHFLMKTRHPIATLYSDTSPMEAMSSALAFCILDDPDCNFLQDSVVWDREIESEFRGLATDLIIRSDDCEHASMSNDIDEILARGIIGDEAVPQLLAAVLHAADVSYMCKPRHIYLEWAFRYMAENYRQGDAEAEYGEMYRDYHPDVPVDGETRWLQISKLCDRNAMPATELQKSVMEHIVLPFVTLLNPFLPAVWVERLEANFRYLQEDEEEKTIVLQNGVQEQLWKKGIATHWMDVPPQSGKNFLQVIRNWISAELPENNFENGGGGNGDSPQPPSKVAAEAAASASGGFVGIAPSASGRNSTSSRPSNVSELEDGGSSSVSKPTATMGDTLRVKDPSGATSATGVVGKKRLSVSQQSPVAPPTITAGLSSVHVLTGEMLKHMHTLLHAGVPGSWDSSRETAIFAQEWVKLLKTLESQDCGPALLSTLATNNQFRVMSTGGSSHNTTEEEESISIVEVLRDQTSPFAHFRPGKPSNASSSSGDPSLQRRESVNDVLISNSPFACAVLLTQMWWILYGMVEDIVNSSSDNGIGSHQRISTPVEPGLGRCASDDDLSVSQKRSGADIPPLPPSATPPIGHHRPQRKDSMESDPTQSPNHSPRNDQQQSRAAGGAGMPRPNAPTPPPPENHHREVTPTQLPMPAPPVLRDMMSNTRRPSSGLPRPAGAAPVVAAVALQTTTDSSATPLMPTDAPPADPSPVKYVLQKRASITKK